MGRAPAQAGLLGAPQWLLLCARSGERPLSLRNTFREADLGQGTRSGRASDPAVEYRSVAGRHVHMARGAGRDQLVFPELQPADEAFLSRGVGEPQRLSE